MFAELQERVNLLREALETEAGIDPIKDRFNVGYIAAVNDLLRMEVQEVEFKEIE